MTTQPARDIPGFGRLIRQRRDAMGLTQRALSGRTEEVFPGEGLSAGYLGWLERGGRAPSRRACRILSRALNLPLEQLLKLSGFYPQDEPARLSEDEWNLIGLYRQCMPGFRKAAVQVLEIGVDDLAGVTS